MQEKILIENLFWVFDCTIIESEMINKEETIVRLILCNLNNKRNFALQISYFNCVN